MDDFNQKAAEETSDMNGSGQFYAQQQSQQPQQPGSLYSWQQPQGQYSNGQYSRMEAYSQRPYEQYANASGNSDAFANMTAQQSMTAGQQTYAQQTYAQQTYAQQTYAQQQYRQQSAQYYGQQTYGYPQYNQPQYGQYQQSQYGLPQQNAYDPHLRYQQDPVQPPQTGPYAGRLFVAPNSIGQYYSPAAPYGGTIYVNSPYAAASIGNESQLPYPVLDENGMPDRLAFGTRTRGGKWVLAFFLLFMSFIMPAFVPEMKVGIIDAGSILQAGVMAALMVGSCLTVRNPIERKLTFTRKTSFKESALWLLIWPELSLFITLLIMLVSVSNPNDNANFEESKMHDSAYLLNTCLSLTVQIVGEAALSLFLFSAFMRLARNSRYRVIIAAAVSSLLFGLLHYFAYSGNIAQCIVIGMSLMLNLCVYLKTENFWLIYLCHLVYDLVSVNLGVLGVAMLASFVSLIVFAVVYFLRKHRHIKEYIETANSNMQNVSQSDAAQLGVVQPGAVQTGIAQSGIGLQRSEKKALRAQALKDWHGFAWNIRHMFRLDADYISLNRKYAQI